MLKKSTIFWDKSLNNRLKGLESKKLKVEICKCIERYLIPIKIIENSALVLKLGSNEKVGNNLLENEVIKLLPRKNWEFLLEELVRLETVIFCSGPVTDGLKAENHSIVFSVNFFSKEGEIFSFSYYYFEGVPKIRHYSIMPGVAVRCFTAAGSII
ncbi:MAG: hypothetical protein NTY12_00010 [Candidatus Falkowbacteria bacterium]|nr:hypothetical protein [Candidatus Falkowbacteria bacterium]